jgi:phospholipase/carboxylesterase
MRETVLTRREMLGILGATASGALGGCLGVRDPTVRARAAPRLKARPGTPTLTGVTGKSTFATQDVDGVVYVPTTAMRDKELPVVVMLHGALRTVDVFVDGFAPVAEEAGVIVLAPFSDNGTWDAIQTRFGPDVTRIDAALSWLFARWKVSPSRIVMSGFSDGGTYAIAMGRANGDLFSRVVAYSPGFLLDVEPVGRPPFLITHGTKDEVLPIDSTSRVIVPLLRNDGYEVDFREFDGPHAVPLAVANEVMRSLAA